MSTIQKQLVADNSSQANFQQWAQGISTALSSLGWVKTSDTGQVDWSANPAVPAANGYVYEIWRANDSLQSTCPIVFKIEYGSVTGPVPSLRFTVGTGSNGSGIILNAGASITVPNAGSVNLGATQWECDFSGTSGRISILMWRNASNAVMAWYFAIERSKSAAGADTDSYFVLNVTCNSGKLYQQHFNNTATGGISGQETSWMAFMTALGSAGFGNNTAVCPVFPLVGKVDNPLMGTLIARGADVPEGMVLSVNIYGATHTYIASKAGALASPAGGSNATLMLWE